MHEPARLSRFVFVDYTPDVAPAWRSMPPATALTAIVRQAFNYGVRGRDGFTHLARLVDECPAGTLTYSTTRDAVRMLDRDDLR
jgi:hypothetical protein